MSPLLLPILLSALPALHVRACRVARKVLRPVAVDGRALPPVPRADHRREGEREGGAEVIRMHDTNCFAAVAVEVVL